MLDEQRPNAIGALDNFVARFEEVYMPGLKAINWCIQSWS